MFDMFEEFFSSMEKKDTEPKAAPKKVSVIPTSPADTKKSKASGGKKLATKNLTLRFLQKSAKVSRLKDKETPEVLLDYAEKKMKAKFYDAFHVGPAGNIYPKLELSVGKDATFPISFMGYTCVFPDGKEVSVPEHIGSESELRKWLSDEDSTCKDCLILLSGDYFILLHKPMEAIDIKGDAFEVWALGEKFEVKLEPKAAAKTEDADSEAEDEAEEEAEEDTTEEEDSADAFKDLKLAVAKALKNDYIGLCKVGDTIFVCPTENRVGSGNTPKVTTQEPKKYKVTDTLKIDLGYQNLPLKGLPEVGEKEVLTEVEVIEIIKSHFPQYRGKTNVKISYYEELDSIWPEYPTSSKG